MGWDWELERLVFCLVGDGWMDGCMMLFMYDVACMYMCVCMWIICMCSECIYINVFLIRIILLCLEVVLYLYYSYYLSITLGLNDQYQTTSFCDHAP